MRGSEGAPRGGVEERDCSWESVVGEAGSSGVWLGEAPAIEVSAAQCSADQAAVCDPGWCIEGQGGGIDPWSMRAAGLVCHVLAPTMQIPAAEGASVLFHSDDCAHPAVETRHELGGGIDAEVANAEAELSDGVAPPAIQRAAADGARVFMAGGDGGDVVRKDLVWSSDVITVLAVADLSIPVVAPTVQPTISDRADESKANRDVDRAVLETWDEDWIKASMRRGEKLSILIISPAVKRVVIVNRARVKPAAGDLGDRSWQPWDELETADVNPRPAAKPPPATVIAPAIGAAVEDGAAMYLAKRDVRGDAAGVGNAQRGEQVDDKEQRIFQHRLPCASILDSPVAKEQAAAIGGNQGDLAGADLGALDGERGWGQVARDV